MLKQQAAGLLPPTPRRLGTVEVWSHMVVGDGVDLTLEPSRARLTPEQVRAFFRAVTQAYAQVADALDRLLERGRGAGIDRVRDLPATAGPW